MEISLVNGGIRAFVGSNREVNPYTDFSIKHSAVKARGSKLVKVIELNGLGGARTRDTARGSF
jgi:hypothetical protein